MSDAWARLCESVGETPETVLPGCVLVGKRASLGRLIDAFWMPLKREKRRTRRALRKARFAMAVELKRAMRGPFLPWEEIKRELLLYEATPGAAGQSAASCGAKEGRSTDVASR